MPVHEDRSPRRVFLRRALLASLGVGLGGGVWSTLIEPTWLQVTRRRIGIPGLSPSLEGRTIAHLSDLHLGFAPAGYLERCAARVRALGPDLVLLTGDYVGGNREADAERIAEILGRLHPPLGTFAVSGNHDFGVVHRGATPGRGRVLDHLRRRGVEVIDNRVVPLGGGRAPTWLAGLGDLWAGRCRVRETFARLPPKGPRIVLAHNPDSIPGIAREGADLVLSGHTHGGQVDIPLLGPPILPVRLRKYYSGLYRVGERTRLYVSNGVGWLRRVRFNARPEIALHTLFGE